MAKKILSPPKHVEMRTIPLSNIETVQEAWLALQIAVYMLSWAEEKGCRQAADLIRPAVQKLGLVILDDWKM